MFQQGCWQNNFLLYGVYLPVESVHKVLISGIHKLMTLSGL